MSKIKFQLHKQPVIHMVKTKGFALDSYGKVVIK